MGLLEFLFTRLLTRQFWMFFMVSFMVALLLAWRVLLRDGIFQMAIDTAPWKRRSVWDWR